MTSSIDTVTLTLKPNQSLFHGSPTLFAPPYLPHNIENRFSCETKFPLYYATKSCSSSPGEGYLYEYKIADWAKKTHGGIPEFIFLQGDDLHDSMQHYISMMKQEPVVHRFTDDEIRQNMPHGFEYSRVNAATQNDLELACICRTKYNGIYVPKYENQLLICGRGRPQWLEIHNIFRAVKGKDGKITTILFQSFPDFISESSAPPRPPTPITAPVSRSETPDESHLSWEGEKTKSEGKGCAIYEGDKPLSLAEIFGDDIFKNDVVDSDSSGYDSSTSSIGNIDHMFDTSYNPGSRKRALFVPVHVGVDERKEGETEIPTVDSSVDGWDQICTRTVIEKTTVSKGKAEYRKKIQIKVEGPTTTPLLPQPIRVSDTLPIRESVFKQSTLKQNQDKKSAAQKKDEFLFGETDANEWPTRLPVWTANDQNRWSSDRKNRTSSSSSSYGTDSWDSGSWHRGKGGAWHNGKHMDGDRKKWNDKDTDRFDEEVHTGVDPIVKFYRNEAVNKAKRRLSTIWNWSDDKLESQHDFIQWIFPLVEKSRFNYDAPVLTKRSIKILRSDNEIQANIKVSFDKMFAFYGWKVNETLDGVERMTIDVEKDGVNEKKLKPMEWLRHSHNFDRITRIMTSLKFLGRTDLSELFFMALCRTAKGPNARKIIASSFIEYWIPTQDHFLPTNVLEAYCNDITERRKAINRLDNVTM